MVFVEFLVSFSNWLMLSKHFIWVSFGLQIDNCCICQKAAYRLQCIWLSVKCLLVYLVFIFLCWIFYINNLILLLCGRIYLSLDRLASTTCRLVFLSDWAGFLAHIVYPLSIVLSKIGENKYSTIVKNSFA